MKIALLGGTGRLGKGLALQWSRKHEVIVGSRSQEKGEKVAQEFANEATQAGIMKGSIWGTDNPRASKEADVVVFTIPHEGLIDTIASVKASISEDKVILSTVAPMERLGKFFIYKPFTDPREPSRAISAGELIAKEMPPSDRLVSGLHSLPSKRLEEMPHAGADWSALLCGDSEESLELIASLVKDIPGLKPIKAGPLSISSQLESLAALMVNISISSRIKDPTLKVL